MGAQSGRAARLDFSAASGFAAPSRLRLTPHKVSSPGSQDFRDGVTKRHFGQVGRTRFTEECETGSAVHLSLEHLDPVDVAFDGA
jgi:hypothetical protein